jgi:FtsH-binding integral membrane protein
MSAGKVVGYIFAGIAILFGVLFLVAAFDGRPVGQAVSNFIIAAILIGIGIVVIIAIKMREPKPKQEIEITQKIDVSGEIAMEKLKCKNCGAQLDKDSIKLAEGAIVVSCPFCGTSYQMVEEPKW